MEEESESPVNVANLRNSLFGGANAINVLNLTPGRKPSYKRSKENIDPNNNRNDDEDEMESSLIKVFPTEKRPSLRKMKKTDDDIIEESKDKSGRKDEAAEDNNNLQLETENQILPSLCKDRVQRPKKRPPSRAFVRKSYGMLDDLDETSKQNEDRKRDRSISNDIEHTLKALLNQNELNQKNEKLKTQLTEEEKEKEVERLIEDLKAVKSGPEIKIDESTDIENIIEKMNSTENDDSIEQAEEMKTAEKSSENLENEKLNENKKNNSKKSKSKVNKNLKELSDGVYMDKKSLRAKSFSNNNKIKGEKDLETVSRNRTKSYDPKSSGNSNDTSFASRFREHFWPKNSSDNSPSPNSSPQLSEKLSRKQRNKDIEDTNKPSLSSRLTGWTKR